MVDDEIDRHQRIDLVGIAAERGHRVAHRGEIDHRRHAGEVLHQHARRAERDLVLRLAALSSHAATASMSSFLTVRPSSLRSRFSSTTFSEYGSAKCPSRPFFSAAFSEKYS